MTKNHKKNCTMPEKNSKIYQSNQLETERQLLYFIIEIIIPKVYITNEHQHDRTWVMPKTEQTVWTIFSLNLISSFSIPQGQHHEMISGDGREKLGWQPNIQSILSKWRKNYETMGWALRTNGVAIKGKTNNKVENN